MTIVVEIISIWDVEDAQLGPINGLIGVDCEGFCN